MKWFLCLFCLSTFSSHAQTNSNDPVKQIVEFAININDNNSSNIEELSDHFEALLLNPVCINQPTSKNIDKLIILSDFQEESLADYIATNGELKSMNELQYVPGFDAELVQIIAPFITIAIPEKRHLSLTDLQHVHSNYMVRSAYTFQNARGFTDTSNNRFLGNKLHYAFSSNIKLGKNAIFNIHSEKDAGEPATLNRGYFDSFGVSLMVVNPIVHVNRIIAGDYRINLGQGLLSWTGFSTSKSSDPSLLRKKPNISTCKSFDEVKFYRGAAIEANYKPISLTIAASNRWLDGHTSTTDSAGIIILTSGLHRSAKEILDRSTIQQKMVAAKIGYQHKQSSINLNFFCKTTTAQLVSNNEQGTSIDFYRKWKKYTFFGEVAADKNTNIATFIGTSIKLSYQAILTASYRKYPKTFAIKSNSSFGESSNATNEEGFYIGLKISPKYRYSILAYVDMFQSPYPKYRVSKPSDGTEAGISLSGLIGSSVESRIRFRYKTKEMDIAQASGSYALTERTTSYKGDTKFRFIPDKRVEFGVSGAINWYSTESSHRKLGYLTFADFQYSLEHLPIRLYTRFCTFDADSWDVALYSYENDLPGMYASSSFFQKGSRAYMMIRTKLNRQINIWAKIAETFYSSATTSTGSGMDQISSNRKTDIRLQVTLDL